LFFCPQSIYALDLLDRLSYDCSAFRDGQTPSELDTAFIDKKIPEMDRWRFNMIILRRNFFMLFILVILLGFESAAFASDEGIGAFDTKSRDRIHQAVADKQVRIMPQLNKLNFGFGQHDGNDYYFTKTISRIFFQDLQIETTITDVQFDDNVIRLELSHPILGNGDLDFVFSDKLLKQASEADIEEIVLNAMGDENHLYVFANPGGKNVHLFICNHLDDRSKAVRMTLEYSGKKRYKRCNFCFKKMMYLPDLSLEIGIEKEWSQRMSEYHSMLDCTDRQEKLQKLGEEILAKWPLPLMGYDYAFHLVEHQDINAFAVPTGAIVVTSGLLDALENDEELEALLVLAIAHVEKRHSLKQYKGRLADVQSSQKIMSVASAAGSIAGAFAGGLWGAFSIVSMDEDTENIKPVLGFQNIYESEAAIFAALYFDIHDKSKQNLVTLIRKLQFNEMTELLHPDLNKHKKPDFETRIHTIQSTNFLYFGKEKRYRTKRLGKFPYELDLLYQHILSEENMLNIYVTDKRLLSRFEGHNGKQTVTLMITDKNRQYQFKLDKPFTTEDTWGVFLTFSAGPGQKHRFLQDIETIVLKIGAPVSPNDRQQVARMESFTFVEGKLEYGD